MKNNENKEFDKNNEKAQNNVQWMICHDGIGTNPWEAKFINSNEKEVRKEMMKILEEFVSYIRSKEDCNNRLISRTKDEKDIQKVWFKLVPNDPNNKEKGWYLNAYADYLNCSFDICACIVPKDDGE